MSDMNTLTNSIAETSVTLSGKCHFNNHLRNTSLHNLFSIDTSKNDVIPMKEKPNDSENDEVSKLSRISIPNYANSARTIVLTCTLELNSLIRHIVKSVVTDFKPKDDLANIEEKISEINSNCDENFYKTRSKAMEDIVGLFDGSTQQEVQRSLEIHFKNARHCYDCVINWFKHQEDHC